MQLSGNAKRAMDVIERNLSVLYGADYFSDDEWVKIDLLLHKGKYVLSDGPATSNAFEEPLMTFEDEDNKEDTRGEGNIDNIEPSKEDTREDTREDTKEDTKEDIKDYAQDTEVELPPDDSFCQTRSDSIVVSEESASSPPSEQGDSLPSAPGISSETPVETSDEDSYPARVPTAEPATDLNTADSTAPTTVQSAEAQPQLETKAPQGPRYTQEQLDEVRAFNAGLTRAGHKTRPKYEPVEEDRESKWNQDYDERYTEQPSYPSPPPTEREARVDTWADGVTKLPPSLHTSHIESPTPNRSLPNAPAVEVLAEQFIKAHGRQPKSLNDFYQPNNPRHQLKRPESQASMQTSRTSATLKSMAQSISGQLINGDVVPPANGIVLGKVYTAQSSAPQKGIRIEVRTGDHIRIMKYVSGIMYIGENLRNKERGQIPETIFARGSPHPHQSGIADNRMPSYRRGLDEVENANAAEWDDVSSIRRPETAGPTSRPHLSGGLAASRFSNIPPDRTPATQGTQDRTEDVASLMTGQLGKIINDKVDEILKARIASRAQTPAQVAASKGQWYVEPRTETCWFWSVKNDCRFTAEECRDLHAYVPRPAGYVPKNLRNNKPTWGAIADHPEWLAKHSAEPRSSHVGVIGEPLKETGKTCYYWAVLKNCNNTAESCRYLHEHSPHGVASKPSGSKVSSTWKREWRNLQDKEEMEAEGRRRENGLVLEEVVQDQELDAWGEPVQRSSGAVDGWGQPTQRPSEAVDGWGQPIQRPSGEVDGWGEPIQRSSGTSGANASTDSAYKPPHVRELEEMVAQAASSW